MKKRLFVSFVIVTLFMLLIGCSSEAGQEVSKNTQNESSKSNTNKKTNTDVVQELVYATIDDPVGLSPIGTYDTVSDKPIEQMYERLFEKDPETGKIVPRLATSYELVDDYTWVFELREGVKFHDGTPFNADAVKYTFEKLVDPEFASPAAHLLTFIDKIKVIDDHKVEIKTKEPYPNFLTVLTNRSTAIVSPTASEQQNLMQNPVGTGPFKFESWVQGDRVILVRNEEYWGELPKLEKVVFRTVPEQSTAISMLETGEVHMVDGIEQQHISRFKNLKQINLLQAKGTYVYFYGFNMEKEPMNQKEFRKAVAHAIDIDGYINLLGGTGYKAHAVSGPSVVGYDKSIENYGYDYDPDLARQIIEENGYGDYELTLYTADRRDYRSMAEVIQAQLTEAGFNIKIEMMDWGTLLDVTSQGEQDMFVLGSSNSMNALATLESFFHTSSVGRNNRSYHSDPQFDAIIESALKEMNDERRQELINQAHQFIIENGIVVPVYHKVVTLAVHESVEDMILSPDTIFSLRNAYRK
jgi:peptide/nickel transport system substrate-binding protein